MNENTNIEAADIEIVRSLTGIELRHRIVRSYVLRQGRLTLAQTTCLYENTGRIYGIEYTGELKNFNDTIFSRQTPAELILEIGFGNGEQLQYAAINEPDRDHFIGVEVHGPGVGRLLNYLGRRMICAMHARLSTRCR